MPLPSENAPKWMPTTHLGPFPPVVILATAGLLLAAAPPLLLAFLLALLCTWPFRS